MWSKISALCEENNIQNGPSVPPHFFNDCSCCKTKIISIRFFSYIFPTIKDLVKEFKSELSGKLLDVVQGLMMTPSHYDAYQLNKAIKGLGTDEDVLIEILCTRSNSAIEAIKEAYDDCKYLSVGSVSILCISLCYK